MAEFFLSGRAALNDAMSLVAEYGAEAPSVAAARANDSRDKENILGFCHWRQIERAAALLASDDVAGTLH